MLTYHQSLLAYPMVSVTRSLLFLVSVQQILSNSFPPLLLIVVDFGMMSYIQKSISKIEYKKRGIEMEMAEIENFTNGQIKRAEEFLDVSVLLTDEELQALDKQISMTQELFDRLCDRLSEIGAHSEFFRLLNEYPEFLKISADKIEKELESSDIEPPEMAEEESRRCFEKLMEQIKNQETLKK